MAGTSKMMSGYQSPALAARATIEIAAATATNRIAIRNK